VEETSKLVKVGQYSISESLFERGFREGSGPCSCSSTCCEGGVYADVIEQETILAHRDIIKKYMDETQTRDASLWFEDHQFEDSDFASGRCVGTREINDKCAFLDGRGRCSLQVAATGEGMHKWRLKPLFCILYPIEVSNHIIGFDDMLQDEQTCCSAQAGFEVPVFEACKEELLYLIGEAGYQMLENHYATRGRSNSALPVPVEGQ
jgi:hypothetical protein